MSIHFYADDAGCVGEPDMPGHAQDVLDDARTTEMHIEFVARIAEDLLVQIDHQRDGVLDDPHGYTHHHAAGWREIMLAAADLAAAADKLRAKVMRA